MTDSIRGLPRCIWAPGVFVILAIAALTASPGVSTATIAGPDEATEQYNRRMEEGILNDNLARYGAAEADFRAALEICERQHGPDDPKCGDVLVRLGLELSNQRRFEEADLAFARAEDLTRRSSEPLDFPRYLGYRAMDLANRGDFAAAFKRVLDANQRRKALVQVALAAARSADEGAKRRFDATLAELAHGLLVQGGIALRLDRVEEARVTAHLARRLITTTNGAPDWWLAFADELLADIDFAQGNVEAAEERLQRALKTKQLALGNTRAVALSRLALSSVYQAGQRNARAVETARPGLGVLHSDQGQGPGIDVEQVIPFLMSAYAEAELDSGRRQALHGEMFGASQLVRTSEIARTIGQMAARFSSEDPEIAELVRQSQNAARERDRLRLELGRAIVSLGRQVQPERVEKLRQAYVRAAKAATALERELIEVFPDYANFVALPPMTPGELASMLRPDEALVRFIVGERGGFVFLSRAGTLTMAPLVITRPEVDAAVRRIRTPFDQAGGRIAPFDMTAAHELYLALFGSIEKQLTGVRHLVTVSSGALLSLPFGLLIAQSPAGLTPDAYGDVAWLARRMAVSMMPSVRAFANLRKGVRPSEAPLPFVGFGDPDFSGGQGDGSMAMLAEHCQVGDPMPTALIRGLAALPETANELNRVARALGADPDTVYIGADASEERLRQLPLERYRVVYFATHGFLPGELRCQSEPALALSPPAAPVADRAADGLLEASEIATLRLDADLVVLSACNTGGGSSAKFGGESLSGLARAFFQAGARSMIVSHWQVDSTATAQLMSRLFERLAGDNAGGAAESLRLAQLDMVENPRTAHPFFWAAFTYVGAGLAVPERQVMPGNRKPSAKTGIGAS